MKSSPLAPDDAEVSSKQVQCPQCDERLASGDDLEQHVECHAVEQGSLICSVCSALCQDAATFIKHVCAHAEEKPFKCDECGKGFREKCSLTRHLRTHTGERPFRCEVCEKSFSDVGSFGRHKKTHMGSSAKVHACPFKCGKSFIDKSSLKRHVKTHTGEKPYKCQTCSKSFTESGSYKRHLRVHTGEKRYSCRVCHRAFSERASMKRHERNLCRPASSDLDTDPDPSSQELDLSAYSIKDMFRSFVGKAECDALNNNNNNVCGLEQKEASGKDVEGENFARDQWSGVADKDSDGRDTNSSSPSLSSEKGEDVEVKALGLPQALQELSDNSSSSSSVSSRRSPWPRPVLQGGSMTWNGTAKKMQLPLMETTPVVEENTFEGDSDDWQMCFECGDPLSEETAIKRLSAGSKSSTEKLRKCSACYQSSLTFSKRGHRCSYCGKSFSESSKLKRHVKIHLGVRDYKCQVCGKGFIEASSLRRHESVHSDVKPHNCLRCGKGFTDSSGLKKHSVRCKGQPADTEPARDAWDGGVYDSRMVKVAVKTPPPPDEDVLFLQKAAMSWKGVTPEVLRPVVKVERAEVSCEPASAAKGNQPPTGKPIAKLDGSSEDNLKMAEGDAFTMQIEGGSAGAFCSGCGKMCGGKCSPLLSTLVNNKARVPPCFKKIVKCPVCPKFFPEEESLILEQHMKTHVGLCPSSEVSCPVCWKIFLKEEYLEKHMKTHKALQPPSARKTVMPGVSPAPSPSQTSQPQALPKPPAGPASTSNLSLVSSAKSGSQCTSASPTEELQEDAPSHRQPVDKAEAVKTAQPTANHITSPASVKSPQGTREAFSSSSALLSTGSLPSTPSSVPTTSAPVVPLSVAPPPASVAPPPASVAQPPASVTPAPVAPPPTSVAPPPASVALPPASVAPPPASTGVSSSSAGGSLGANCLVCGKVFADLGSLKRHTRLHAGQQTQFPCENCSKVFWDQGSLKRHWLRGCKNIATATGDEDSGGGDGRKSFEELSTKDHFTCTQCRMVFSTREEQTLHEKEHRVRPSLRCSVCRQSLPDADTLQRHLLAHAAQRPLACDVCLKGFADQGSLGKHRARGCYSHSPASLPPSKLPCHHCGKVFSDQTNFDLHVSSHRGLKPFACSQCGKSFTEACSLKRHTRLHTGQNLCRCLHCGRTFLENSGLKKHLQRRSCLQEKKPVKAWLYSCTLCRKVFNKRYILLRHMKIHLGLRPFACDKCDKSFTESSSLKRHYRQHTGERPYRCHGCTKTFTDAGVLKKHKHRCPYVAEDDDYSAYMLSAPARGFGTASAQETGVEGSGFRPSSQQSQNSSAGSVKVRQRDSHPAAQLSGRLPSKSCWRCGRTFPSMQLFQLHLKAAHSGTLAFQVRPLLEKVLPPSLPSPSSEAAQSQRETCLQAFEWLMDPVKTATRLLTG